MLDLDLPEDPHPIPNILQTPLLNIYLLLFQQLSNRCSAEVAHGLETNLPWVPLGQASHHSHPTFVLFDEEQF